MGYFGSEFLGRGFRQDFDWGEYWRNLDKYALKNLKKLPDISLSALEKELKRDEKYWNERKKFNKSKDADTLSKIVHAAQSHHYVPKITMLKSVIKFKKKLDKTRGFKEKDRLIKDYHSRAEESDYLIKELSALDSYLNTIPNKKENYKICKRKPKTIKLIYR